MGNENVLMPDQHESLLHVLQTRFENNMYRHKGLEWSKIQVKFAMNPGKLLALNEMEKTGGEPDVVGYDEKADEYIFFDCSKESPEGRRNICYDQEAIESRKKYKPGHSAIGMAAEMGIRLLNEKEYRELQQLGNFDTKTSSWIFTPEKIRASGGAIFGDWRYGETFIYHNGAESYYAARGFRGSLRV